jgi:tetratricopeptide (TPR) repeat protein
LKQNIRTLLVTLALVLASAQVIANDRLDEAKQLIREGRSEQAYALLLETFDRDAGNPDYDYLFGVAAMDAGHPTEAVFAFERVLDTNPDHAEARIELARAYFKLSEYQASQQEFETVRTDAPPAVRSTIDRFLAAIKYASAPAQKHFEAFIQAGLGYDSNVNAATDSSRVTLPGFGNILVTLDDSGVEKGSTVAALDTGVYFEKPLNTVTSLYGRGYLTGRGPLQEEQFSTETLGGTLGLLRFIGQDQVRLGITGQKYFVDEQTNLNLGGAQGIWQHLVDSYTRVSVFGKYVAIRYPDQDVRNVNQASGGVSITRAIEMKGDPVLFASLAGGNEDERDNGRPDMGRDFYGISIGGLYTLRSDVTAVAGLGYQRSRYGATDPLFATTRVDNLFSASAGMIIGLKDNWDNWEVRPVIRYTNNDSTIPINDYSRWQAFVNVRRTFQ